MWLQNLVWLASIALVFFAQFVKSADVADGADEKRSGNVKIKCVKPGEDDTNLSLTVSDKALNDLEDLVKAMCAGHTAAGMPSLWEASWEDHPDDKISNFLIQGDPSLEGVDTSGFDKIGIPPGSVETEWIDNNDITDDVTKIEDEPPAEAKNEVPPSHVTVNTYLGKVKGLKNMLDSGDGFIYSFLGVPYAQPPTGNKRFKPPLPVTAYGEHEAFGFRNECPQVKAYGDRAFEFQGDEDCLYLNIFSPSLTKNAAALKPVMVFFHGGAFTMGAGNEYIPVEMAIKDVVVVTVNYRLSALGFMTFGNDIVSGNMGLRDQLESLRWVKRFINNFGGDPDKVTIFGQSSGAMMVHALQLSPKAQGLFKYAIAQSGNMLMRRVKAEISDEKRIAKNIAEKFECPSNYDQEMLECLQKLPVQKLIQDAGYAAPNIHADIKERERGPWFPVVDAFSTDPILPLDPLEAMKTGKFNKVPFISGTMANDGAIQVASILGPNPEKEKVWKSMAAQLLMLSQSANVSETKYEDVMAASIVTQFYTNEVYDFDKNGRAWIQMMTDALFLSPDQKAVELYAKHGVPVYNYYFNYKPNTTISKIFGFPDNELAPINGEDILHLFDQFSGIHLESKIETKVGNTMIDYWTNFAKYGNPSPFDSDDLVKWEQYTDKKAYLEIKPSPEMKYNIAPERMTFWQRILWDKKEDTIDRHVLYAKLTKLFLHANSKFRK